MADANPDRPSPERANAAGVPISRLRLDTLDSRFADDFEGYQDSFLCVLSHSYDSYHGDAYHLRRLREGQAILYFAVVDRTVVGASYVKRNLRRGGTAVEPGFRRMGIAEKLISMSLDDFPEQYSILSAANSGMIALLLKLGFASATSIEQAREVTRDEFGYLSDFELSAGVLLFRRHSQKRSTDRDLQTLLYRGPR